LDKPKVLGVRLAVAADLDVEREVLASTSDRM
jgi:hypothetical protein